MQEEIWKDVVGLEDRYLISNYGNLIRKSDNKTMKGSLNSWGYRTFSTKVDGKIIYMKIHRMVAEVFLERPSDQLIEKCSKEHHGKVLVNHKDGNKTNNYFENLEWCSHSENMKHVYTTGLYKNPAGVSKTTSYIKDQEIIDYIRSIYIKSSREFGAPAISKLLDIPVDVVKRIVAGTYYK